MMKNKTFTLTLTEEQLDLVWDALDEYREYANMVDMDTESNDMNIVLHETMEAIRAAFK